MIPWNFCVVISNFHDKIIMEWHLPDVAYRVVDYKIRDILELSDNEGLTQECVGV